MGTDKFIKVAEVLDQTGLSKPTLYRLIIEGDFPKQIKITPHSSAWSEEEVSQWQEERKLARNG